MNNSQTGVFTYNGMHLLIDARTLPGFSTCLNDMDLCRNFMSELCSTIDMTIIYQPTVIKFPVMQNEMYKLLRDMEREGLQDTSIYRSLSSQYSWDAIQNSGVTGFTVISESHCAMHTWPEQDFLTFCLYSCKPFDHEAATKLLVSYFSIDTNRMNKQVITRVMPD